MFHRILLPAFLSLAACTAPAGAQEPAKCSQQHPGHKQRAESLAKRGDARMARSAAGHTTKFAVERYGLQERVGDADLQRVSEQLYRLLCWQLGTPAAVAGQWVSAGYEHFDRGYVDEACAMLIGALEFEGSGPQIRFPPFAQKLLEQKAGKSTAAIEKWLVEQALPAELARLAAAGVAGELSKALARNTVGFDLPKKFDFDNQLLPQEVEAWKAAENEAGDEAAEEDEDAVDEMAEDDEPASDQAPTSSESAGDLGTLATLAEVVGKLSQLLQRLDGMETRIAALESARPPVAEAALSPAAAGYHGAWLNAEFGSAAVVRVAVNGLPVARYDSRFQLDLAPFLSPGKVNSVAIAVEPRGDKKGVSVSLVLKVQVPGNDEWRSIYQFAPDPDRLQDTVDLPFANK